MDTYPAAVVWAKHNYVEFYPFLVSAGSRAEALGKATLIANKLRKPEFFQQEVKVGTLAPVDVENALIS